MRRANLILSFLVSAAMGCGGSSGGGSTPVTATVHDLQTGVVTNGHEVILSDVVVMAISVASDRVWVSDGLTASARSGVEVYRGGNPGALGASVGDHIRVEGTLQEFGQGAGGTVTQVASPTVTLLSAATSAPVPVTGLNLASITQDATGEDYEGVLVTVTNVKVTATAPYTLGDGVTDFGVGEQVAPFVQTLGTCFATVTGIWNYDTSRDDWIIVPVAGGLVTGAGCL